ncbi:MAG: putative hydrolase of the HAD superfamily [Acidimicrobiales bacterium]|jgi:putative hydrolase of the HAD superfamily
MPRIRPVINAVLFDFGGVVLTSPFEAFNTYEEANGLPLDLIRTINTTNPDDNAWAKLERSDVSPAEFADLFQAEAAALGHQVDGSAILGLLSGDIRPEMVEAIRRIGAAGFKTACLTNNFVAHDDRGSGVDSADPERASELKRVMAMFDEVVESARVGIRKPELGFYEIALDKLGIEASEAVFLDDLGINLKPARAMGMTTIKVESAAQALAELEQIISLQLR